MYEVLGWIALTLVIAFLISICMQGSSVDPKYRREEMYDYRVFVEFSGGGPLDGTFKVLEGGVPAQYGICWPNLDGSDDFHLYSPAIPGINEPMTGRMGRTILYYRGIDSEQPARS